MTVRYSVRAVADIAEIFRHIAGEDLATALAVEADIRSTCESLAEYPYASPRVRPRLLVVEIARVVRGKRVRNLRRLP